MYDFNVKYLFFVGYLEKSSEVEYYVISLLRVLWYFVVNIFFLCINDNIDVYVCVCVWVKKRERE